MTIMERPDSEYCYKTRIFTEGKQCPDLDDTETMKPKCKKYGKILSWTRSGVIIKCDECRQQN